MVGIVGVVEEIPNGKLYFFLCSVRYLDICIKNDNLIVLALHVIWCSQCLWHVVEWVGRDCVEERFHLLREKFDRWCGVRLGIGVSCCGDII